MRPGDTVARLGGDEFAILLEDCPDAREVADRVVASMAAEAEILGHRVRTSISVGLAHHEGHQAGRRRHPQTGGHRVAEPDRSPSTVPVDVAASEAGAERQATAALLIRLADTAMYAAKSAGKGRAAVLDADPVLTPRG